MGKPEKAIQTLEQYFSNIEQLIATENGKYFTILPTDEEYFEINANSRVITVPEDFRKNGLGVKGDQIAEVVYFEIDRYFDIMDLNNTQIFIQWKNPENVTGVSIPWVKDLDTHTDKLIFGWPIDHEITAGAGSLQFSVRFVQFDSDDVDTRKAIYSLSTLTATVTINPSITEIDESQLIASESVNEMIRGRIKNTTTNTNDDIETKPPVFLEDCFDPLFTNIAEGNCLILDEVKLDADNPSYSFEGRAYLTTTWGELKYGLSTSNENYLAPNNKVTTEIVYKDAYGKIYNDQAGYYNSNGEALEVNTNDVNAMTGLFSVEKTYYQPICVATVDKAGKYFFAANAYYNSLNNYKVYSKGYIIPGPGTSTISTNNIINFVREDGFNNDNIVVTNTDTLTDLTYIWKKKVNDEFKAIALEPATTINYVPETEGSYQVTVKATRNNETNEVNSNELFVYNRAIAPELELITADGNTEYTIGEIITCNITNNDDMKNVSYSWYYTDTTGKVVISSEEKCTLPSAALGNKVTCEVINYNGFEGNSTSATIQTNFVGNGR